MVSAYLLGSAEKHCIKYKNIRCLFDGVFLKYIIHIREII